MIKHFFLALLGITFVLSSFSCKPYDDTDDPNVIIDDQGVKLDLTWSNSATDPTDNTTFSLQIAEGTTTLLTSGNFGSFGNIELEKGSLNDGTYKVNVVIYEIDRSTNYKITATGMSTGKSYSADFGPLNVNDVYVTLYPLTLTVTGSKFKLNL
jgi:hypothetical protein